MESKKVIRKHVLNQRSQIAREDWERKSAIICSKIVNHPVFLQADVVYCYVDYRQEVGTREIIQTAWRRNKKVAVPKVEGEEMQFYYIQNFTDLSEGYRGILEPNAEQSADEVHPLVIMPGAVFDKVRNRIGYGKGYYDRFLAAHPSCRTLAIAFELQVMEQIPADPYDICPEILITEEKIYD